MSQDLLQSQCKVYAVFNSFHGFRGPQLQHPMGSSDLRPPAPFRGPRLGPEERDGQPLSCTQLMAPNRSCPQEKQVVIRFPKGWRGRLGKRTLRGGGIHGIKAHLQCLDADAGLTPGGPELVRVCRMRTNILPAPGRIGRTGWRSSWHMAAQVGSPETRICVQAMDALRTCPQGNWWWSGRSRTGQVRI